MGSYENTVLISEKCAREASASGEPEIAAGFQRIADLFRKVDELSDS